MRHGSGKQYLEVQEATAVVDAADPAALARNVARLEPLVCIKGWGASVRAAGLDRAMIEIDGSAGEGGGQIVRTALALSMCTGTAVVLRNIRVRRSNPGLRAQHLAAVHAAAAISGAEVDGDTVGSRELLFEPGPLRPGHYDVDVGTAGSTMLVLQTILPALSRCKTPTTVKLRGGTHNPRAPTFEFVRDSYLPLLARLGFKVDIALDRYGFFPAGAGIVRARIEPFEPGRTLELLERGSVQTRSAEVLLAGLPGHIAQREIAVLRDRLGLSEASCTVRNVPAQGAGNALCVRIDCMHVTAVFASFGIRGLPAEEVASRVAYEVERYVQANVAVDTYLADQLLLPMALAAGGIFSTMRPSLHTETNSAVIRRFLPMDYRVRNLEADRYEVDLRRRPAATASVDEGAQ